MAPVGSGGDMGATTAALSYPCDGMRCAVCGTENAPDSRFCGGCGARTAPSTVAPTQKMSDDAPMPTQAVPSLAHAQTYANHGPASIPPPGYHSIPPTNYSSIPPTNNPASVPPTNYNSIPPTNNPASVPPVNNAYGSQPPSAPGTVQRRATAPPTAPTTPSVSMPRKGGGTRWGIVLFVLALDLGLAVAGAWMLRAGLADTAPAPTTQPAHPSAGTQ